MTYIEESSTSALDLGCLHARSVGSPEEVLTFRVELPGPDSVVGIITCARTHVQLQTSIVTLAVAAVILKRPRVDIVLHKGLDEVTATGLGGDVELLPGPITILVNVVNVGKVGL